MGDWMVIVDAVEGSFVVAGNGGARSACPD
jgi:hypothetical protein